VIEAAGASAGGAAGSASAGTSGAEQAAGSGGASGSGTEPSGGAGAGTSGGGSSGSGGAGTELELVASPSELAFAVVQQTQSAAQTVTLKNPSAQSIQLGSIALDPAAAGTGTFELISGPKAGDQVAAGVGVSVQIRFHPTGVAEFQSALLIQTQSPATALRVGLYGLGTKGLEGANEPFLKSVLDTLGFDVNVGSAGLLGTNAKPVGDEVAAPRFKAASAADVELVPVARYSPQEAIPYGYYTAASEVQVGVISSDQYQTLDPTTDPGSKTSFSAPAGEFGIFTSSTTHSTYTEDAKNAANATKHGVRTFPLKDRAGKLIPSSYLLCFEEAANGDYQDYVFTLSNVVPALP
jgi:hypothetical protein